VLEREKRNQEKIKIEEKNKLGIGYMVPEEARLRKSKRDRIGSTLNSICMLASFSVCLSHVLLNRMD
jgi:hypothetical protein